MKVADYINKNLSFREEYYRIFNKSLPSGKCFCPFHDNHRTPAAKVYIDPNGIEVLHCFSEQKNYSTYDLLKRFNPSRIDEIKSTIVVPESEQPSKHHYTVRPIDRTKSIDELVVNILNYF